MQNAASFAVLSMYDLGTTEAMLVLLPKEEPPMPSGGGMGGEDMT